MKTNLNLSTTILLCVFLIHISYITKSENLINKAKKHDLGITTEVKKIIDNSCFMCHNAEAKGEKAKVKLMFESLDTLSASKLIGILAEISDEVSENKMPPAKFLEYNPSAKLTSEQKEAILNWAESCSNTLLEE